MPLALRRALGLVAWLALVALSLAPRPGVDRALERVLSPLRFLAQVTWPVRALGGGPVLAADAAGVEAAELACREALADLSATALPGRADLLAGRRPVPGQVVERDGHDTLVVEPWTLDGVDVGQPVVHRHAYVGRVAAVDRAAGRVTVALVTGRDFYVGAALLDDPDVTAVVGGVVPEPQGRGREPLTWLAAHHPSRFDGFEGVLVVREPLPDLDPFGALAEGYALGVLAPGGTRGDWRLVPERDFLHGLYHVVVLTPGDGAPPEPPPHPLAESRWIPAQVLAAGDPAAWRSSLAIDRGAVHGVREGAAVVVGPRLVGRVGRVSALGAEVRLLDDPGLSLGLVGRQTTPDAAPPEVLGLGVALGRDPRTGRPLLHWRDALRLGAGVEVDGRIRYRLFTGAGEEGLPAGLLVGEAWLPVSSSGGRGHVLQLEDAPPPRLAERTVWVRAGRGALSP